MLNLKQLKAYSSHGMTLHVKSLVNPTHWKYGLEVGYVKKQGCALGKTHIFHNFYISFEKM